MFFYDYRIKKTGHKKARRKSRFRRAQLKHQDKFYLMITLPV
jgi:hypothetical protein